jgi:hypothetical protein
MPYIIKERRKDLTNVKVDVKNKLCIEEIPKSAGELNYMITTLIQEYIFEHKESYQTYNDVIGVLECAKLELYRRKISKYEDLKIKENGDVYE